MNISENNQPKKLNLDISLLNKNIIGEHSKVIYCNDDEKPKIRLINAYVNLKDNQYKNINLDGFEEENDAINDLLKKSILNIIDVNTFNFKQFFDKYLKHLKLNEKNKKESKKKLDEEEEKEKQKKDVKNDDKEESKKEKKEESDDEDKKENKEDDENDDKEESKNEKKEESDDEEKIEIKEDDENDDKEESKNEKKEESDDEEKIEIKEDDENEKKEEKIEEIEKQQKNDKKLVKKEEDLPIIEIRPAFNKYNKDKLDELTYIIDIYGEGLKQFLKKIYEEKQNNIISSIFSSVIHIKRINLDNINQGEFMKQLNSNNIYKNINQKSVNKKEKYVEKKDIIKRSIYNEERTKNIKYMLEDMCVLGNKIKNEIIQEKQNNCEKYISIEEATKNNKNIDEIFCLGLLAKNLENCGIITAIEKNPEQNDETIKQENIVLQFILNGLAEKKKYDFHFDFGEEKNNELLNNKEEQEKFHTKLKKKLSLGYNIPEEEIIITNPQKGSYQVDVIFMTEEFNTNIDADELKKKFKDDKEFKEISYLNQIHKSLIMEGCKLSTNMLDPRGNKKNGWSTGQKRGGFDYYPPLKGWKGFGVRVIDKYDNGNNDWIQNNGNSNEWAIAYHGTGVKMGSSFTLEKATNSILSGGFKAGWGQAYAGDNDARHPGKKVGIGVYCSPNPYVMESYARCAQSSTNINGIHYMMGFMMRVKPERIRYSDSQKDYWVLNGSTDEMRPYRIMVKAQGVEDDNGFLTYVDAMNRRNNVGNIYYYNIKGNDSGTVWGDHIYTDDSNIAKAAVLEGLCKIGEEKIVGIKIIEPKSSYNSICKNGISSSSWGYWEGSYIFV